MTRELITAQDERAEETISIRVNSAFKAAVQQWADDESRTMANFVRWWLEQYPKLRREKAGGN